MLIGFLSGAFGKEFGEGGVFRNFLLWSVHVFGSYCLFILTSVISTEPCV